MGFLDNLKNSIANRNGDTNEETVRIIDDYDEYDDTSPKSDNGNLTSSLSSLKNKFSFGKKKETEEYDDYDEEEVYEDDEIDYSVSNDSAFDVEESVGHDFIKEADDNYKKSLAAYGDTPDLGKDVLEGRIMDVLELLKIPKDYFIDRNMLLPKDLEEPSFSIETPMGYSRSEVKNFYNQVEYTIENYVKLLESRNKDIAKLATVVDRLQVDLNNLKYESEISNTGISVIPSSDSKDLSNQLMEAKLTIRNLEDKLQKYENDDDEHNSELEELNNKYSMLLYDKEVLERENYDLRNRLNFLEEQNDNRIDEAIANANSVTDNSFSDQMPTFDDFTPQTETVNPNSGLPSFMQTDMEPDAFPDLPKVEAAMPSLDDGQMPNFEDDMMPGIDSDFGFDTNSNFSDNSGELQQLIDYQNENYEEETGF